MNAAALMDGLVNLGLNRYEAKVYLALLSDSSLKASELSKRARVPQQKVYDALYNLHEKGFCHVVKADMKMFSAVEPSVAMKGYLGNLRERYDRDIEAKDELISTVAESLQEAFLEAQKTTGNGFISIVQGKNQVSEWFLRFLLGARKEYLVMSKPPYVVPRSQLLEPLKELVRRRVKIRMLIQRETSAEYREFLKAGAALRGADIRPVRSLPIKLTLFDRTQGLIALRGARSASDLTALIFQRRELHTAFRSVFDEYWNRSGKGRK